MKPVFVGIGIILICAIIVVSLSFFRFSKDFSRSYSIPSKIEAIVVLTGGKGRLQFALKLFEQYQPKVLFIAGAGTGLSSIFSKEELEKNDASKIVLDQRSRSTYQNAEEAKAYMTEHGIRSFVLVTSNYHMKRAFFLFREIFPSNIEIIPYAIEVDHVSFKIALSEYIKYYWQRWTKENRF